MELLFLLLLVGVFVLFVSNRAMAHRLERLEHRLLVLESGPVEGAGRSEASYGAPLQPAAVVLPELPVIEAPEPPPAPGPQEPEAPPAPPWTADEAEAEERETLGGLFERLVAGRLLIWLGGIALVVAGVYLIRYSIEIGLVTPELRMIAAGLFGLLLLALGEYARAGRLLSDDPRIAQALVGAGLAILYATTYGSHILYGLVGPGTASALMLAVTAAALGLSLRHGAPTAVMGLAGGFLTPLLVGDPDAGAVPLLAYLALLDLALFLIAWRRGWTWLAAAAVALSFVWSAYLLAQPPEDALAAGFFVLLLAVAASLVRPGEGRELGMIQPLLIAIVQLGVLVARADLGLPAWGLFAGLAAASLALAAFRREYRLAPPLAVALALALLLAKAATGADPLLPPAAAGTTLLFGLGGIALRMWQRRLLWTLIACAGFVGPALILRSLRPELLDRPVWSLLILTLAAGPILLAWLERDRAAEKAPADLALLASGGAAALLLGAAVWDLLPRELIAAGWLVVALAAALAARRLGDLALTTVAVAAAAVAVARAAWMVPELSSAMITALIGLPVLAADLPDARAALTSLAVPALLIAGLWFVLPPLLRARRGLPAVAGLFAGAAAYVWFKQSFGLANLPDFVARGMIERTILDQALFAAGWLLASGRVRWSRVEPDLLRLGGAALTAVAAARLVWFDLLLHNPAWAAQWVGPWPVLNLLLPAYGLSAVWLYLARRRAAGTAPSGLWLAAFLGALVAGALLLVRQAFQGPILTGPETSIAEYYGYSLAGLVLSVALLVAGVRLPDKALRLAGLVLLTATMLKVFLVDASALEGVLRILSFLGLGVALIGIGRLYGPILRAERAGGRAA
ncbi:DUF2339 domain-containing protein [Sphingosinicella terrae]|uniref:DUF2339 domain-containing protein n=1 Tax=Sphingosinicella terrae TaxID=2172047 RepID=UPI000E0D03E4|nr:DUF2339 domain-containing protein [Sphingosinicella terrae]